MVILSADRTHWGTRVWVIPSSLSVKAESVLIDEGERESHIRGRVIITLTANHRERDERKGMDSWKDLRGDLAFGCSQSIYQEGKSFARKHYKTSKIWKGKKWTSGKQKLASVSLMKVQGSQGSRITGSVAVFLLKWQNVGNQLFLVQR